MLCFVVLCCVGLRCVALRCVALRCVELRCVALRCVVLRYVTLRYVTLRYVMLCYVMLCYVMLCYVMLCYVMLCYVTLCYVNSLGKFASQRRATKKCKKSNSENFESTFFSTSGSTSKVIRNILDRGNLQLAMIGKTKPLFKYSHRWRFNHHWQKQRQTHCHL